MIFEPLWKWVIHQGKVFI